MLEYMFHRFAFGRWCKRAPTISSPWKSCQKRNSSERRHPRFYVCILIVSIRLLWNSHHTQLHASLRQVSLFSFTLRSLMHRLSGTFAASVVFWSMCRTHLSLVFYMPLSQRQRSVGCHWKPPNHVDDWLEWFWLVISASKTAGLPCAGVLCWRRSAPASDGCRSQSFSRATGQGNHLCWSKVVSEL